MALRWAATTFCETEKNFRRVTGYQHLWMLKAHLDDEDGALAGDHIWWISDVGKFRQHYPEWRLRYDLPMICAEIHGHNAERWAARLTGAPPSRAR